MHSVYYIPRPVLIASWYAVAGVAKVFIELFPILITWIAVQMEISEVQFTIKRSARILYSWHRSGNKDAD